ncbi:MAG: hypothetical protein HYX83_01660 [Chloroflexi bacterium]|nr:hypothetical protein [Chloroflexota bacterium]
MARFIQMIQTNCKDKAREAEFNEWYNKVHLPDIMETPGFLGATRYEIVLPATGEAKFLAIYEIEADDLEAARKALSENMARKRAAGRFSDLVEIVPPSKAYREISSYRVTGGCRK